MLLYVTEFPKLPVTFSWIIQNQQMQNNTIAKINVYSETFEMQHFVSFVSSKSEYNI